MLCLQSGGYGFLESIIGSQIIPFSFKSNRNTELSVFLAENAMETTFIVTPVFPVFQNLYASSVNTGELLTDLLLCFFFPAAAALAFSLYQSVL